MTVCVNRNKTRDGNDYITIETDQEGYDEFFVEIEHSEAEDVFLLDIIDNFSGEVDSSVEYTRDEIVALRDAINELLEVKE